MLRGLSSGCRYELATLLVQITGHNIERSDYVITNATIWAGGVIQPHRDIHIHLDTCLRCGQQWHETIVEKAKGVEV